ncbi:MAG TPA: ABC transporter permease [Conexibacter sp.]|jgi:ABC-2 type transport system permease protein|nr:ABC transporter permease [Conexibacter sp.]
MATTSTAPASKVAPAPPPVRVVIPPGGLRADLRGIKVVWQRELIRFWRDRLRIVTSLFQPLIFLFVLGGGLSHIASGGTEGVDLRTFMFPGALAMAVLFTAMFSAASVVWDREYGFLREMLVAPVRRGSIVLGKCFGGATVASFQGILVMALAPLVGVPYAPLMILEVLALQLLLAFMITAFGVMAAVRITQMQAFMALMQMIVMPLLFLSGALFPLSGLPRWLAVLNRLDPLTYAVNPIRVAVFRQIDLTPAARAALLPGITWFGWQVPLAVQVLVVAAFALAMLQIAIWQFRRA